MKHTPRLSAFLLGLALVLVVAEPLAPARAQETVSLGSLTIRLWPEYDQPTALVFYIGKVSEGTTLPVDLHFRMPPGAVLHATAYLEDQTGDLLTAASRVEGDVVTVTSPNGSFHVEFYDPGLKVEGDQRTYSLLWQGDYPVEELVVEAQQPVGARDMTVEPAGGSWTTGSNNLQVYTASRLGLQAGQQVTVSMSYTKPDSSLTVDALAPASPGDTTQAGRDGQIIGMGVLGAALLIAIGGAIYLFKRRGGPRAPKVTGKGARFCTRCGHAAGAGDRFCRQCGASLD